MKQGAEAGLSQEKTEGIVLRKVDFGDTSAVVTFLTPDRGRLACLAKGMRRKNSGLAAVLDTFNRVELVYYWKDGRGVQNLAEASLLEAWPGLKRNVERLTHAAFLLELCQRAVVENAPAEELYGALSAALAALAAEPGDARAWTACLAHRILCVLGHAPELGACADTGAPPEAARWFSHEHGLAEKAGDRRLTPGEALALRVMADTDAPPERAEAGAVFDMMAGFAARQLETDFRSTRVLRQMFG